MIDQTVMSTAITIECIGVDRDRTLATIEWTMGYGIPVRALDKGDYQLYAIKLSRCRPSTKIPATAMIIIGT